MVFRRTTTGTSTVRVLNTYPSHSAQVPWPEEMIISSTKNQDTELPSKKLDYKWAGPFQALA